MDKSQVSDMQEGDDIINHQNIVLRYYSLTGMISYADAPAFHTLVKNRDFRIVCVFEVFSQTRCEDDFLENLALIGQILKEQELQGGSHSGSNMMLASNNPYQSPQHSSNSGGISRPLVWDIDSDQSKPPPPVQPPATATQNTQQAQDSFTAAVSQLQESQLSAE